MARRTAGQLVRLGIQVSFSSGGAGFPCRGLRRQRRQPGQGRTSPGKVQVQQEGQATGREREKKRSGQGKWDYDRMMMDRWGGKRCKDTRCTRGGRGLGGAAAGLEG
jgi:hypothetical protein